MSKFSYNISTLFGNLNNSSSSGNLFNSINLSDYYSIKKGSYGKLLKTYYTDQKTSDSSSSTKKTNTTTSKDVDKTGMTQMKKNADELKSAAASLSSSELWKQSAGSYDTDKIVSAVKDFAQEYNNAITQASKVSTTNTSVSSAVGYMKSMTTTMTKALSNIGITVGTDGKLSVDEEKLKNAKMNDVKALMSGNSSYAGQIADKASEISRAALMSSSIYDSTGTASSTLAGLFDGSI